MSLEILDPIAPYFLFFLGACLGSFANVVIYRWPAEESVVKPRSRCRSCGKPLAWYDNIPIASWFLLRGKCRYCKAPYSFRYAFVEILTGALFTTAYFFIGPKWFLIEVLIFLFGLVCACFIDFDHFLLPDVITLPGIVIGLLGALLNPERSFLDALFGAMMGFGILWSIAYFYFIFRKQEGMGGGDLKLLAWIGAVLGWKAIPFVIISSSFIGSIVGVVLMLRSKKGLMTMIPFGPYLALGAVIFLFGGESLGLWYLRLFLPFLGSE